MKIFNPFQPSVAFHKETSHLICSTNQMTGYYIKGNRGLKWVNLNSSVIRQKGESQNRCYKKTKRTCVYQGVRNVCFSENLACFVFL